MPRNEGQKHGKPVIPVAHCSNFRGKTPVASDSASPEGFQEIRDADFWEAFLSSDDEPEAMPDLDDFWIEQD